MDKPMTVYAKRGIKFALMLKGFVGLGIATLALFGVSVEVIGVDAPVAAEGAVATIGGVLGAVLGAKYG